MGKVSVHNIRTYAYHGCLPEEGSIGSDYLVNLDVSADLSVAAASDKLRDTVDYVQINEIVKEEMKLRSKLLEHVAKRIIDHIFSEIEMVSEITVSVSKLNPPIGGDVEAVTVTMNEKRG
jgi:dihydroneopterin aldolase